MSVRRTGTARKKILSSRFPVPLGTDIFEYDDDVEIGDEGDMDDEDDDDDDGEEDDDDRKKKKRKKKRRKKRKKRKGKGKRKRKRKGKKRGKKKKKKRDGKGGHGGKKKKKKHKDDKEDKRVNSPKSMEVVKQTIRTKRDGSQVVDLTVDVDRIGRADKYEFRVVKKDNGDVKVVTG